MTDVKTLLQYQEVDGKLMSINKKIATDENAVKLKKAKDNIATAKKVVNDAKDKAEQILANYEKATVSYEKALKQFTTLATKLESLEEDTAERKETVAKLVTLKENLVILEKAVVNYKEKASGIVDAYNKASNSGKKNITDGKELEEKVNSLKSTFEAEVKTIKAELTKISAKVDKDLLAKYEQLKESKKFPAVVKAEISGKETYCVCGMSPGPNCISEINDKNKGVGFCENCKRILYKGE